MAMSTEQKQKLKEHISKVQRNPCEICDNLDPLIVHDDPVCAIVWQPEVPGGQEGVVATRVFPFAVACCAGCGKAHLFPWGPLFGFAPPKGAN